MWESGLTCQCLVRSCDNKKNKRLRKLCSQVYRLKCNYIYHLHMVNAAIWPSQISTVHRLWTRAALTDSSVYGREYWRRPPCRTTSTCQGEEEADGERAQKGNTECKAKTEGSQVPQKCIIQGVYSKKNLFINIWFVIQRLNKYILYGKGFLKAHRPPKESNEMKCTNERMTYKPNANVDHTIIG